MDKDTSDQILREFSKWEASALKLGTASSLTPKKKILNYTQSTAPATHDASMKYTCFAARTEDIT